NVSEHFGQCDVTLIRDWKIERGFLRRIDWKGHSVRVDGLETLRPGDESNRRILSNRYHERSRKLSRNCHVGDLRHFLQPLHQRRRVVEYRAKRVDAQSGDNRIRRQIMRAVNDY